MENRISRRHFSRLSLTGAAALVTLNSAELRAETQSGSQCIRLGGPVSGDFKDPQEWIKALKAKGYSAAYCPVSPGTDIAIIKAFEKAAKEANILISEVGAWSNPISKVEKERKEAIRKCKDSLSLADQIGAGCCVNISGSRGEKWDGPHSENYSRETFEMIVQTTREIIDEVKPLRTFIHLKRCPGLSPIHPIHILSLLKPLTENNLPCISIR